MGNINVAIIGIGNCCSSLVQGVEFYKKAKDVEIIPGLMHVNLGGYHINDINFVLGFDVNSNKVGKDMSEAIFAEPNSNMKLYQPDFLEAPILKGPIMDGLDSNIKNIIPVEEVKEAVKKVDIIVTTTPSRKPLVKNEWVEAGTHVNCIGPDAPGKEELDPTILKRAKIGFDDWEQGS